MRKLLFLFPLLLICSAPVLADGLSELAVSAPRDTTKVEAVVATLTWGQAVNLVSLNNGIVSDYRSGLGRGYFPADSLAERGIVAIRTSSGTGSAWITPALCQAGYEASGLDATMSFALSAPFSPAKITIFTPSILADNNPRLLFRASAEKLLTATAGQIQMETPANAIVFIQAINPAATKTELWWRVEYTGTAISIISVPADGLLNPSATNTNINVDVVAKDGDVNLDGKVTVADAPLALRAAIGLVTLPGDRASQADVNGDGQITPADATLILRLALGLG